MKGNLNLPQGLRNPVTVLLDIDKVIREGDSKLILASMLAARGMRTVLAIGGQNTEIAFKSKKLIWFGKGMIPPLSTLSKPESFEERVKCASATLDKLQQNCSAAIYTHDEGGIYQTYSWHEMLFFKHKLHVLKGRDFDRICTWGERQKYLMADYLPQMRERITTTGSIRFDLCRPEYAWLHQDEIADIRSRFSPYILMCTRFGSVASMEGDINKYFRQRFKMNKWSADVEHDRIIDIVFTKWRQDIHDFAEFVVLAKELAALYPYKKIIIRPHPSEGLSFYANALRVFPNVVVIREGNVLSWIRGADLIVHSNCTTGIEGVLAGKPVLSFLPGNAQTRAGLNVEVAHEAGMVAHSVEEALAIAEILQSESSSAAQVWTQHAHTILHNLENTALPLTIDQIFRVADERNITNSRLVLPSALRNSPFMHRMKAMVGKTVNTDDQFDRVFIKKTLAGCRSRGQGGGTLGEFCPTFAVINPD